MAKKLTTANFNEEVLQSDKPVLVDFWATWCMPCKMLAPTLEELSSESTDFVVGKVDIDENPELAQQYRIMSIPTLLVFKNGKVTASAVGVQSKAAILNMLK
ncbi:MAG: thioredoxin [Ruminococcus sp.]|nr:thioredoxin [Ruminococcus sp.]